MANLEIVSDSACISILIALKHAFSPLNRLLYDVGCFLLL